MSKGLLENAIDQIQKRKGRNASVAPDVKPLKKKKPVKKLDETKPTATSPKGVQKTKAQGEEERRKLREKQKARRRQAQKDS